MIIPHVSPTVDYSLHVSLNNDRVYVLLINLFMFHSLILDLYFILSVCVLCFGLEDALFIIININSK